MRYTMACGSSRWKNRFPALFKSSDKPCRVPRRKEWSVVRCQRSRVPFAIRGTHGIFDLRNLQRWLERGPNEEFFWKLAKKLLLNCYSCPKFRDSCSRLIMKTVKIADSEWEVMNVVWEEEPWVSASRVVEVLSERKGWHSRTTRTLLERLVKKGVLETKPEGKRYLYRAAIDMEKCVRQESRSFARKVFGGEPAAMLLHLVKETDLTQDDIAQLKKILEEKEQ